MILVTLSPTTFRTWFSEIDDQSDDGHQTDTGYDDDSHRIKLLGINTLSCKKSSYLWKGFVTILVLMASISHES
ncbi:hypothetical protein HNQ64_003154 [Prosthecobacter dejongeii]|uniref:Uncharacterized protein n=1 Tax=Prosthecobacter dejongeii TaxID=48465 RepID=A0A7W7YMK0_9BACT|nr:hypothetical protein [Prosthecobacter dejongeii]